MSVLSDLILDTFPANADEGVPLLSNITITLSGEDYDYDSLKNGLFVEGPDTDQYIGPGLLGLVIPDNVSQGDVDDFLQSPGYQGIVEGVTTVTGEDGDTLVTFNPTRPLAASTDYRVNLTSVEDDDNAALDGFVTFAFTTGTGSITELPSNISSSVLTGSPITEQASSSTTFKVTKITPGDHAVEVPVTTEQIVVEFNKSIKASSVAANLSVKTIPATDHPNATTNSLGDLAVSTTVEGNKLIINI